jgi:hypothetical protein
VKAAANARLNEARPSARPLNVNVALYPYTRSISLPKSPACLGAAHRPTIVASLLPTRALSLSRDPPLPRSTYHSRSLARPTRAFAWPVSRLPFIYPGSLRGGRPSYIRLVYPRRHLAPRPSPALSPSTRPAQSFASSRQLPVVILSFIQRPA